MAELVSVIVLNYNGKEYLQACLDSVLAQSYPHFEILFVDNASGDGSVEFVRDQYHSVAVIVNDENLGFAGGNNRGVEAANGSLIVLLNNDTIVHEGWLQALVDAISPADVGTASSLIKTEGVPEEYYFRNGTINFTGHNIMLAYDDPEDLFYSSGCSMIFRKPVLGLPFDDDYFAYSEDAWLGLRTRFLGLKVRHTNASIVDHFGSGTSKRQLSDFITFYQERNRLLNSKLFFSWWTRVRWVPYFGLNCFLKLGASLLRRKYSFKGLMRAYIWLCTHPRIIAQKRKVLRAEARAKEKDVILAMSCKITNSNSWAGRLGNALSLAYSCVVGLKTIERSPARYRAKS